MHETAGQKEEHEERDGPETNLESKNREECPEFHFKEQRQTIHTSQYSQMVSLHMLSPAYIRTLFFSVCYM